MNSGLQAMETIPESGRKTAGVPGVLPEAALFSVVRPNQLKTDLVLSAAIDGLSGRSSSLKTPLTRKAREWVKRSNTSRTTPTPGLSASDSLKAHIKHLGGGRLEEVKVKGPANNTTLLAPAPIRRGQRSRSRSTDSRATQWLDFYTGSPEASKRPTPPPPAEPLRSGGSSSRPTQPSTGSPEAGKQSLPPLTQPLPFDGPSTRHVRPESNSNLRPAPLRVPSSERYKGPSPPPKPLERKNSKWKPLPNLPPQGLKQPAAAEMGKGATQSGRSAEPATPPSSGKQKLSLELGDLGVLPIIRFGTPPPTPDSSTGGVAEMHADKGRGEDGNEQGRRPVKPNLDVMKTRGSTGPKVSTADTVRHTRQERIWLHVNYRGESPFLKAWGLDITKLADRLEGLAIVRELIQAEAEGKRVEDI